MPTNSHYETVRKAVIAACPELMELSFGCKVLLPHDEIVIFVRDNNTFVGDDENRFIDHMGVRSLRYEIKEIIGHPIRLSHIIRTIEMSDRYEYNKDFEIREVVFGGASYENREDLRGPHWNLLKDDLAEQSPSVWEALDKMLSV